MTTIRKLWAKPSTFAAIAALLGIACAIFLPAFSGPDEKAHLAYVVALAQGHLPAVPGDVSFDLVSGSTYEAQQPPIFYLLATPLYIALGTNVLLGLYALRLLCVVALVGSVLLIYFTARQLFDEKTASIAAFIAATNPVLVYVCSMLNNESLAAFFSIACMAAAVKARDNPKFSKWILFAAFLGGAGLLTKLTALPGVIGAAWIIGLNLPKTTRWKRAAIVAGGGFGLWAIWGAFMISQHGNAVPSPFNHPLFSGGFGALLLFPGVAAKYAFILATGFGIGLVVPQWLQPNQHMYFLLSGGCGVACYSYNSILFLAGIGIIAWLISASRQRQSLRFVPWAFLCIYLMMLVNLYFRDLDNVFFPARYTPTVIAFSTLLAAVAFTHWRDIVKKFAVVIWLMLSTTVFAQIFFFFLR